MTAESFGSILGAIYRRRVAVLLVLLGSVAGGTIYLQKMKPEYLAQALIMIPSQPPTTSLSSEAGNLPSGPLLPDSSDDLQVGAMGVFSSGVLAERLLAKRPELDIRALRKNLRGNIDEFGNIQVLSYAASKELAAEFANEFALCFQEEMESIVTAHVKNTAEAMRREEPVALAEYRKLNQDLVEYLAQIGTVSLDEELGRLLAERTQLEGQVLDVALARVRSEAERPVLLEAVAARPEFSLTRTTYGRNPAYEAALERVRALATELALARLEYMDGHPQIERLLAEFDLVSAEVRNMANEEMVLQSRTETPDTLLRDLIGRLATLDIAAASYDAQIAVLSDRRAALDTRLSAFPAFQSEVALRMAELGSVRAHWERLKQRLAELEFHLRTGIHFTVMSDAMRAKSEQAKQIPTTVGLYIFCVIAGISGGLLYALFAEMLARMRASRPF